MALSYQNYTGDNTTTQFSIPFTYQDTAEISVTVDGVAETGLTFPSSSTVQLTSAPASGTLVQVRRTTNLTARAVDFASGSVLTEEDLDDSNIQVFHAAQESVDLAGDSIQLGNDNKWDAQNSVIKNVGTPTASTDAATKSYTDTEVAGVVSSAVSQATAAATTTAQAEVAAATSTIIPDATKLAIHPIGTQYTLSDGVTSDFSSKHYANVASTNATTATNAASTASTDAGTASTAATAAQVAQAAAEAALDTFDDRFLGAKASDPSVDNDGNALLDGAIYFNTTSDIMKVYDQANTIWRDLALTGTDQTNVNLVAGQISPTNNIATVAGISADITTTATNNANITTVATSIADVNAVGTDIANVNTVATNLSSVNAFADTYFVSATAPASPTLGDLWFDTTNDIMKVYSSSGFVNAGSSVNGTANRYVYTATASQTSFAATYDAGYVDVYLNGVKLQSGTDFTATDGANVVLTVGAALNDQIDIVGYGTFNIAIPDISGDLTPELGGDLATSGNDITFGDNDKAIFGAGNDLQIYHDSNDSYINDTGTGNLRLAGSANVEIISSGGEFMAKFVADGASTLYHDNAAKLATTATGVSVTGTVTADGLTVGSSSIAAGTGLFQQIQTAGNNMYVGIGSNNSAYIQANGEFRIATGGYADRVTVDSSGSVGIGTTTNNQSSSTASVTLNAASGMSAYELRNADVFSGYVGHNGTNMYLVNSKNGSLGLYTNNAERMHLTSTGNVGIGTVPESFAKLEVKTSTDKNIAIFDNAAGPTIGAITDGGSSQALRFAGQTIIMTGAGGSGAEHMRIDSSGNVGIGVTSMTNILVLPNEAYFAMQDASGAESLAIRANASNAMEFLTGGGERMRITSAGNVGINQNNPTFPLVVSGKASNHCSAFQVATNGYAAALFYNASGGFVGQIQVGASSTAYVTTSDYRLKTAVNYDWDATTRLKQLRPARFEWIADGDDAVPVDGFLAHEVQDVVPEAITGTHNGMRDEEYQVSAATGDIYTPAIEAVLDDDGNEVTPAVAEVIHSTDVERPEELEEGQQWRETTAEVMGTRSVPDYQGIDQSKLVPLLVKTIQELEARIAALENV